MYKAMEIANYVINRSIDIGAPVTNLKLNKLLYYIQGASLIYLGEKLFKEDIVAWRYGPTVKKVYDVYKYYSSNPIEEKVEEYNIENNVAEIINSIIEAKKDMAPHEIVERTRNEEPWIDAKFEEVISTDSIKKYFVNNSFILLEGIDNKNNIKGENKNMRIFECESLKVENIDDLGLTVKIRLSYENLMNFYSARLQNDESNGYQEMLINFKDCFEFLNRMVESQIGTFELGYNIADKGKKIKCLINNKEFCPDEFLDTCLSDGISIHKLKEIFCCKDNGITYLSERIIKFEKDMPIVLKLLGELLVYLLDLDRK